MYVAHRLTGFDEACERHRVASVQLGSAGELASFHKPAAARAHSAEPISS